MFLCMCLHRMLSWFGGLVLPAAFHTFRMKISFVETPLIFFCQPRNVFELASQLCNWISDQTLSGEVSFSSYIIYIIMICKINYLICKNI